jgi:hypothetical protein
MLKPGHYSFATGCQKDFKKNDSIRAGQIARAGTRERITFRISLATEFLALFSTAVGMALLIAMAWINF